jgi:hypothetical protein
MAEILTDGPWRYDPNSDHGSPIIFGPNGEEVVAFSQADYDTEAWFLVKDVDGYLLAASRDLLHAAEAVEEWFNGGCRGGMKHSKLILAIVKAAIVKARATKCFPCNGRGSYWRSDADGGRTDCLDCEGLGWKAQSK